MKQNGSSLRAVEQDSTPESRSVPLRFGNESLYVKPRTKEAFDLWRNTQTNYTRNSDAINDRLEHSLTIDGYLPEISAPYQTKTNGVIITSPIMAAIQRIQNMRGNNWNKETSQQEILEELVKAGARSIESKHGLFIDEAAELPTAPTGLASIDFPHDKQRRKESNES